MARICVAGVGAVGSTIAARLLAAGNEVSLIARGTRLAQLRADGLRVDFAGEQFAAAVTASDRPDFGIQDVVFTAAKAQALGTLLPTLAPLIGPQTCVVPLVNGIPWWYFQGAGGRFDGDRVAAVDPQGALRDAIGAERLVGCVLYVTARLERSGQVAVMGRQRLTVGHIGPTGHTGHPGPEPSPRADEVAALLNHAGIATTATSRIRDDLWTKVALNLATNPLSVVTEATLVELFTDPRLLPRVSDVLAETARVARGYGAAPTMTREEMLATGRNAGAFDTSMLQDYRAGRPLELAAIGASVLELAAKIGEHMPVTQLIVDLCAHCAARREGIDP
jgi:2-dehydropantoate 2-reductase